MKGIQYLIDDHGQKRAAVVDLKIFGHLWEDIHDVLVIESRKDEPRTRWEDVKKKLKRKARNDNV